jgi:hypothetical protein
LLDPHIGDLRLEATRLPGWMARGSTWPVKRSTSTLLFTPICFSPADHQVAIGQHRQHHRGGDGAAEVVAVGVCRPCRRSDVGCWCRRPLARRSWLAATPGNGGHG